MPQKVKMKIITNILTAVIMEAMVTMEVAATIQPMAPQTHMETAALGMTITHGVVMVNGTTTTLLPTPCVVLAVAEIPTTTVCLVRTFCPKSSKGPQLAAIMSGVIAKRNTILTLTVGTTASLMKMLPLAIEWAR